MNVTQTSYFDYSINFIFIFNLTSFASLNKLDLLVLVVLMNYIMTLVRMIL